MRPTEESPKERNDPPASVPDATGLHVFDGLMQAGLEGRVAYNVTEGLRDMAGRNVTAMFKAMEKGLADAKEEFRNGLDSIQESLVATQKVVAKLAVGQERLGHAVKKLEEGQVDLQKGQRDLEQKQIELGSQLAGVERRSKMYQKLTWAVVGLLGVLVAVRCALFIDLSASLRQLWTPPAVTAEGPAGPAATPRADAEPGGSEPAAAVLAE